MWKLTFLKTLYVISVSCYRCMPFCNMIYDYLLKGFKIKAFTLKISLPGAFCYKYFLAFNIKHSFKKPPQTKELYTGGYVWECMERGIPPWVMEWQLFCLAAFLWWVTCVCNTPASCPQSFHLHVKIMGFMIHHYNKCKLSM